MSRDSAGERAASAPHPEGRSEAKGARSAPEGSARSEGGAQRPRKGGDTIKDCKSSSLFSNLFMTFSLLPNEYTRCDIQLPPIRIQIFLQS